MYRCIFKVKKLLEIKRFQDTNGGLRVFCVCATFNIVSMRFNKIIGDTGFMT